MVSAFPTPKSLGWGSPLGMDRIGRGYDFRKRPLSYRWRFVIPPYANCHKTKGQIEEF